ncbi:MAG: TIGR03620 family F420-dependent LLM class oxidoreductase [Candidatus Limnocylindria bacterium]
MSELGRIGVWGHLDSLVAQHFGPYVVRVEQLGFATLWVPETVGREPFSLLATAAAVTQTLRLGTSIASIWARDAVTMRCSALGLQELSEGRFVLGLGVSHHHLTQKVRGHRYERPLSRMREYLAAYRAAPYRGPVHEPRPEPPIVVAALRERMVELAARETDGAFPYLVTAERVRWMRDRLDAAADEAHPILAVTLPVVLDTSSPSARQTARAYLTPYLRTPNYQASWTEQGFEDADWEKPGSDRLVDAMVAHGDEAALVDRVAELHSAGADHVALIPLASDGTTEHLPTLVALAGCLGL